jgi:hypothetical protein
MGTENKIRGPSRTKSVLGMEVPCGRLMPKLTESDIPRRESVKWKGRFISGTDLVREEVLREQSLSLVWKSPAAGNRLDPPMNHEPWLAIVGPTGCGRHPSAAGCGRHPGRCEFEGQLVGAGDV